MAGHPPFHDLVLEIPTVIHADEILILSCGQIVERGTHTTLLAIRGLYAQLWYAQQSSADRAVVSDTLQQA